ncbi:hypothetical protein EYZ11_004572 [Aspergillus tanneri]|uniref:Uncharacterized protein n=1 Tax=Aspergillus tanneri TaxID=1220188 RepID=A0A4S3JKQ9_9EURO|nr:hypothetical protein EYZ11_004572 [Aspergillus tanneri]
MTVVQAEISYPNPVPYNLAAAFAPSGALETEGPPGKRRKLTSGFQSLRTLNGVGETQIPLGYIPLARLNLYLVCKSRCTH